MRILLISVLMTSIVSLSCSRLQKNKLDGKTQTVQFHYINWSCVCANWATIQDIRKYEDTGVLSDHCSFIEPANPGLALPDTLGYGGDIVEFTGQYYIDKGYPDTYIQTEEPVDKGRVFRYTAYRIIKSNRKEYVEY